MQSFILLLDFFSHSSWSSEGMNQKLLEMLIGVKSFIWLHTSLSSTNYLGAATDVRAGLALFYVLTNVTILAKCPLGNRHTNHQHMIEVYRQHKRPTYTVYKPSMDGCSTVVLKISGLDGWDGLDLQAGWGKEHLAVPKKIVTGHLDLESVARVSNMLC